jgi:hypothetical protein
MSLLQQILPSAIVAMTVAAGICGLALYWGKERVRAAAGPVALGLAYLSGHLVITGRVTFPPTDTTNWLPYLALAAAALGASCALVPTRPWARLIIFAMVSAGALKLLLKPKFQYGWSLGEGWLWVAGLVSVFVLLAVILDALGRRTATATEMPVFLLVTCAGTFGALMLSGSILLGQFAAVLGAAVLGNLVFAVGKVALGRGIVPVFSLLMGALLVCGYFFADLPLASVIMLALAPAFALIPIGQPGKLLAFLIRSALVSVPVLAALVVAFRASPPLGE